MCAKSKSYQFTNNSFVLEHLDYNNSVTSLPDLSISKFIELKSWCKGIQLNPKLPSENACIQNNGSKWQYSYTLYITESFCCIDKTSNIIIQINLQLLMWCATSFSNTYLLDHTSITIIRSSILISYYINIISET